MRSTKVLVLMIMGTSLFACKPDTEKALVPKDETAPAPVEQPAESNTEAVQQTAQATSSGTGGHSTWMFLHGGGGGSSSYTPSAHPSSSRGGFGGSGHGAAGS